MTDQPQLPPRPAPRPVIVDSADRHKAEEERRRVDALRYSLYAETNSPQVELAFRLWCQHYSQPYSQASFDAFVESVLTNAQNLNYVQSLRALELPETLRQLGLQTWPPPEGAPNRRVTAPPRFAAPTAPQPPAISQQKVKAIRSQAVKFDVVDLFETVSGQWVLLVFFVLLTLVDWATNVWMMNGETELGTALATSSVWHWLLGLLLVFTEMYFAMAKALLKRYSQVEGLQRWLLLAMLVIAVLAVIYDLAATFFPPYNLIAQSGQPASILGGVIVGALLAIVTTIGSSKVIEQAIICFELRRQK